jgi:hypothetical protein
MYSATSYMYNNDNGVFTGVSLSPLTDISYGMLAEVGDYEYVPLPAPFKSTRLTEVSSDTGLCWWLFAVVTAILTSSTARTCT